MEIKRVDQHAAAAAGSLSSLPTFINSSMSYRAKVKNSRINKPMLKATRYVIFLCLVELMKFVICVRQIIETSLKDVARPRNNGITGVYQKHGYV